MNEALWIGLGSLLTTVLGGLVAAVIALWNARHKIRQEEDAATTLRQNAIIDRLEHQVGRLDRQIQDQQLVINRQQEMNAAYREESAELRTIVQFLYDLAHRFHSDLAAAKLVHEPMPPMPRFRQRSGWTEGEAPEFLQRTTQQNTELLHEAGKQLKPHSQDPP